MENQLILSEDFISELNASNIELYNKSWILVAFLLATGQPVRPTELASRCSAAFEVSSEFVEFICSIPSSPLSLTTDGLVTVSSGFFFKLERFLLSTSRILEPVPSRQLKLRNFGPKRVWEDVERTYYRKRRRLWPNVYEKADQNDLVLPIKIQNGCAKVCFHVDDDSGRDVIMQIGNPPISIFNHDKPDEVTFNKSSSIDFHTGLLDCCTSNDKHECIGQMEATQSMKELGGMNIPPSKYCFLNYDSYVNLLGQSTTTSGGVGAGIQQQLSTSLTTSSDVYREKRNNELYLLSKIHGMSSCEEDDKNKITTPVEAGIEICSSRANDISFKNHSFRGGMQHESKIDSASHKGNVEYLPVKIIDRDRIPEFDSENRITLSCNGMARHLDSGVKESGQQVKQSVFPPAEAEKLCTDEAPRDNLQEEAAVNCVRDKQLGCSDPGEGDAKNFLLGKGMAPEYDCKSRTNVGCNNNLSNLHQDNTAAELNQVTITGDLISPYQKQLKESSARLKVAHKDTKDTTAKRFSLTTDKPTDVGAHVEQLHCRKDKRSAFLKQKLKPNCDKKTHGSGKKGDSKENKERPTSVSAKDHPEPRVMPNFDSFIVEEEEGSGGYGTVYKARRRQDGTTFAVKYPHVNANKQHVLNELKMLERFGGKNFVIKYEGSFKSGNSHCLVLQHVAHDRPEVLKKEIDVYQLRWYGYCLFRALASLHKQGVAHRDVKPGNFLFARKGTKGYLIDFNLAVDLHHKYGSTEKSKVHHDASFGRVTLLHTESLPPIKSRKYPSSRALEAVKHEAGNRSKLLLTKSLRKKTDQIKEHKDLNVNGVMKSQGADGSGITSTKDATSTKVPSAERLREPIPCQGRKELLNLVHEAMQGPDHVVSSPASKRKRVSAPPAKLDKKFVYLTPMPLHCTGVAVAGAGILKSKGEGKQKREGPCVGTKGFRAPEVLFRSTYQGPKLDIWSAGVTLLYLIIGRTPFAGDPEQNIKEIAKLRGSEDLWEVAKLHDRESSFPPELFEVQSLPATKLRDWCKQNTRRPDFLEVIPRSLLDLVDKCLTVNPRARISAEDALKHEFFTPCQEGLKKQRLLRQGLSLDSATTLPNTQPLTCEGLS